MLNLLKMIDIVPHKLLAVSQVQTRAGISSPHHHTLSFCITLDNFHNFGVKIVSSGNIVHDWQPRDGVKLSLYITAGLYFYTACSFVDSRYKKFIMGVIWMFSKYEELDCEVETWWVSYWHCKVYSLHHSRSHWYWVAEQISPPIL